uniref:Uncharacterized protein n=1 Tax=Knipowitschia caucasica TaxID=637954 RepID=A0AAV2IVC4_KNICA
MLGLSVIPAMIQFTGFLFLPESPRWLIQRGLTQKARRVLSQIRGNQNIDEEYDSIKNSIEEEEKDSGGDTGEDLRVIHLAQMKPCYPTAEEWEREQRRKPCIYALSRHSLTSLAQCSRCGWSGPLPHFENDSRALTEKEAGETDRMCSIEAEFWRSYNPSVF